MRLFVAIPLSEEIKNALVGVMHDLKKQGVEGNYVPARNLHMTLAFIGEYEEPGRVKEILRSVPFPEFRMALTEKGNFGNVLWAGVRGNQKLQSYVKDLRTALKENGIPCADDRFVPHITLVRKARARMPYQIRLPKCGMTAKEASLMQSVPRGNGVLYKIM